jgi:hypothetical protein
MLVLLINNLREIEEICYSLTQIIRLLNDKVCFKIISVQRVNFTAGKKEFCWLLTFFSEGFYLESSFLKQFEIYN